MKTKTRQANLELLRLLSMLMVVTLHTMNHSGLVDHAKPHTPGYYLIWTLFGIGFSCINIYILISGYFLVTSQFSTWRLAKIAGQTFFYAFGITAVFWLSGTVERELKYMVYSILPILSDFYWFVTMYVGMYLLSPLLNRFIRTLTKRQFQCVLAACFVLFSAWTNIIYYTSGLNIAGGVSIAWFLVIYLFGAYIRLHYVPCGRWSKWLLWGVLASALIPVSRFVIEALLATPLGNIPILDDLMWGYSVFYQYNSMLAVIAALLLFLAFLNMKIKPGRAADFICVAASVSLGVYLFHDHYYIRQALWPRLNAWAWVDKWYLLPISLATILAIYLAGMVIELLRQRLFAPFEKNRKIRGFFTGLDERLRRLWYGTSERREL